jgi:type I restriction enzyme S subunit
MSGGLHLGDFFSNRQEPGRAGLPVMSVTMNDSLVLRDDLERRTESALTPDQHLLVRKGDIAYNMMRMWQGACGLATADGIVSPAYVVLAPKPGIDSRFAYHWFKSARMIHLFWAYSHGLTEDRLRLYFDEFAEIPASPPHLEQQRRIVAVLETWDRAIDQTERLIAAKRRLHHSHVTALIPKTADGRSNQWRMRALGELGRVVNGGTPASDEAEYWDGDIPWITPSEVSQLKSPLVGTTERKISPLGLKNSSAELLPIGSLIVCTRATVGACCINSVPMATNQGFKSLVPKAGIEIRYVYHAINARQKELIRLANGSTFLEVTKPDFENFQIAVPSLEQQRLIADALDAEAMEITLLEQRDGLLQSQKRGLMQKLLTGEWRLDERFDPPMLAPRAALAGGAA